MGTGNATLTIAQAPTTTTLAPPGSVNPGQSVTLTATVAPTAMGPTGPPTGTVNFYNGTTLLNPTPVALSAGTALYVRSCRESHRRDNLHHRCGLQRRYQLPCQHHFINYSGHRGRA